MLNTGQCCDLQGRRCHPCESNNVRCGERELAGIAEPQRLFAVQERGTDGATYPVHKDRRWRELGRVAKTRLT